MNRNSRMNAGQVIGKLDGQQVVGLDNAKHVFQLHTVTPSSGDTQVVARA